MTGKLIAFFSRISVRLLAFNLLIVFLPVAAILYLDTYERQLLRSLEHALVQQGRILASALSGQGELAPAAAERVLLQLEQRHEARLRILDRQGRLLADSSRLGPRRLAAETPAAGEPLAASAQERSLYRLATYPVHLYRKLFRPPDPPLESAEFYVHTDVLLGPEVRDALAGRYGAMTRISSGGQRSVTLYSAIPVRSGESVVGAVLISQSTYRILRDLYELRLQIFTIFLLSLAAAAVLSLLLSATIAAPVRKLRRQAREILDQRGRLRGQIRCNRRRDEIGDLSRSLEELTGKLAGHIRFVESFASDISHEFKNPLASIRSAAEMLPRAGTRAQRDRFLTLIQREVARMQHLLGAVQEISLIDARMEEEERQPVEIAEILGALIEARRLRSVPGQPQRIDLHIDPVDRREQRQAQERTAQPLRVLVAPQRLAQVLENLLENALSFSPAGAEVRVRLTRQGNQALIRVEDEGPGIPEQHLKRIFDRFFSYRPRAAEGSAAAEAGPANPGSEHLGLGLAIVKAVVEGYGGSVTGSNREGGGACFEVRLPLSEGRLPARQNGAGFET